jgi:hypothetical protein
MSEDNFSIWWTPKVCVMGVLTVCLIYSTAGTMLRLMMSWIPDSCIYSSRNLGCLEHPAYVFKKAQQDLDGVMKSAHFDHETHFLFRGKETSYALI